MISTIQHHQDLSLLLCSTLGMPTKLPHLAPGTLGEAACWVVLSAQTTVIIKDVQEHDEGGDGRLASGGGSLDQAPVVQKA